MAFGGGCFQQWQVTTLINTFTGRAAVQTQLQILALLKGHDQLLGHANGQGQVVPKLANIHCGSDVPCMHLNIFATDFLHNVKAPGVLVSSTCCTINKSCRQVISHYNSYLRGRGGKKGKVTTKEKAGPPVLLEGNN
uniref:Uncharacterized protein n=1 Tax=Geospiza parvula TaxID=87175 RepID=A0A8C3N135_GEOPR